jgi:hypothetical protein
MLMRKRIEDGRSRIAGNAILNFPFSILALKWWVATDSHRVLAG